MADFINNFEGRFAATPNSPSLSIPAGSQQPYPSKSDSRAWSYAS